MSAIIRRAANRSPYFLLVFLAACGGGGKSSPAADPSITQLTSDRPSYSIGEQAQLTAVFKDGTGHIEPGNLAVTSGRPVTTPPLRAPTTFHLVVTGNAHTATRDISLPATYRDRMRSIRMPFARGMHVAVPMNDGRVLIAGGVDESGLFARPMYVFDPSSETFNQLGSLDAGRYGFVATLLRDGRVLIAGGSIVGPDALLIDPQTGTVAPSPVQPHKRRLSVAGAQLADGRLLIVGGLVNNNADGSAEIYDPATGMFTLLAASLSVPRYGHTAEVSADGRVLIYGGVTTDEHPAPPELYDPTSNTFSPLQDPEHALREYHTDVRASDGSIWIAGGSQGSAASALTSVIRFDAGGLSHALDLAKVRTLAAMAPLTDSRLLISGGATPNFAEVTTSSELIDTATSIRTAGPAMNVARYFHTLTQLQNGRILIVGGLEPHEGTNATGIASAEIFE